MEEKTYRFYIRQGDFELDIEGDQAFVESYVEAFLEEELLDAEEKKARSSKALKALPAPKAPGKDLKGEIDFSSLADFMKAARPQTNKERFLHYVDFLRQQGVADVAAKDVEACFSAQRAKAPASLRQYFQVLKKQRLLEPSGNWGRWRLTQKGIAALGNAKPPAAKKRAGRKANRRKNAASRR
ncbi:MAG: hypothetical protein JHC34_00845 [Acidobacteria bacterium]|nr:hypothetical protein [Acidobacteriota bacterium]